MAAELPCELAPQRVDLGAVRLWLRPEGSRWLPTKATRWIERSSRTGPIDPGCPAGSRLPGALRPDATTPAWSGSCLHRSWFAGWLITGEAFMSPESQLTARVIRSLKPPVRNVRRKNSTGSVYSGSPSPRATIARSAANSAARKLPFATSSWGRSTSARASGRRSPLPLPLRP